MFADELTSERVKGRPELVDQLIMAVVLMSLVIGVVVAIEQSVRANRRRRSIGTVGERPSERITR